MPEPQRFSCILHGCGHDGLIQVHRPNGVKLYWAKRLPDSPLYGENIP